MLKEEQNLEILSPSILLSSASSEHLKSDDFKIKEMRSTSSYPASSLSLPLMNMGVDDNV